MTNPYPPRDGKLPWDADCDATRAGLERMVRALVVVDGHFTCSHLIGDRAKVAEPQRGYTIFFRVWIPIGREAEFAQHAKAELTPPPRIQVGMDVYPPIPDASNPNER